MNPYSSLSCRAWNRRRPPALPVQALVGWLVAGALWALGFSPILHASSPAPPDALQPLLPYLGVWLSDEKTDEDGTKYRWQYRLERFDRGNTILKMRIDKKHHDGRIELTWEGFKGVDTTQGEVYYVGLSTWGFVARGFVRAMDGDTVWTEYSGATPDGSVVEIRDVTVLVGAHGFESITFMKQGGEWKEIMRDRWERTDG